MRAAALTLLEKLNVQKERRREKRAQKKLFPDFASKKTPKRSAEDKEKDGRDTELLRPHDRTANDWYFDVPIAFNLALDICLTERIVDQKIRSVWTQGTNFAFTLGDFLCDRPQTTNESWGENLKFMRFCLMILEAEPATPDSAGSVEFKVLVPNESRSGVREERIMKLSQFEFVRLLIAGFSEH